VTAVPKLPFSVDTSPSVAADASRLATSKNLKAAGDKFESIFTGMMLKSMRTTHLATDIFGSKAQDQFRDMWDQKTVEAMASHAPLGIGKAMTEFLARSQPTLAADTPAAADQSDLNHDPPQAAS
jgi:flagellar protein FlgJ